MKFLSGLKGILLLAGGKSPSNRARALIDLRVQVPFSPRLLAGGLLSRPSDPFPNMNMNMAFHSSQPFVGH